MKFSWNLPRLILIGDGFTDPECADRIVDAVANSSAGGRDLRGPRGPHGPQCEQALWVHLRDRAAPDEAFRECATRLTGRLRAAAPSLLLSVNGRPEAADALQCGYHAGVRDPAPTFAGGLRQPCGRSAHNLDEARAALDENRAHRPQYLFFSPVFSPQGKPGYTGAGIDALRDFAQYVQGRAPVYALGGMTPERIGPCLAAGSYGVAVLSGIMMADRPGEAVRAYVDALHACFENAL